MKYENFKQASDICNKITSGNRLLDSISSDDTMVVIKNYFSKDEIQTIGPYDRWVSRYTPIANSFIEAIKKDIIEELATLKAELDKL